MVTAFDTYELSLNGSTDRRVTANAFHFRVPYVPRISSHYMLSYPHILARLMCF